MQRLDRILSEAGVASRKELRAIIQPEKGNDFCHRLVLHGRAVCSARGWDCSRCCLDGLCEKRFAK